MTIFLLILGLVLFVGLVVAHEWGHFIAARRGGVEVEEFGIGFPPKVWARKVKTKKSKFLFTVNLLPLGGFVRLKGEHDADTAPKSYGAAPLGTKVKIMLAGVLMNLIVAFLLLTVLAATGIPKIIDNQFTVASDAKTIRSVDNADVVKVDQVVNDSPAAKAGIQAQDRIISLNSETITSPEQIPEITQANAGKTVEVIIERNGQQLNLQATLNPANTGSGYLGLSSNSGRSGLEVQRYTWSSPVVAAGLIKQFSELTFKGIGTAIYSLFQGDTQKASDQVAGPVGIFYILKEGGKLGVSFILMIVAIISLTLALINILPIPALDGGRLFVTLLFRALRRPLKRETEELIHGMGFTALMLLFVLITIVDVRRFF